MMRGRYPAAIIPSLLNVFSMQGFLILNCIVGGQTLASVSPDKLNATLGIVIIGVISMLVSGFFFLSFLTRIVCCRLRSVDTKLSICKIISFCILKNINLILTSYETVTWIPNFIIFFIMLGVGGKHLNPSTLPKFPTPSPSDVISCASFVASSVISWCTMTPDYGVYHNRKASTFVVLSAFAFFLVHR
jgi:purine-cytosine permease-like protein